MNVEHAATARTEGMHGIAQSDRTKQQRRIRIVGIVVGAFLALVLAALVGFNVYVRCAFSQFYSQAQAEFAIPGVDEGFIPQDLDYLDDAGIWLFSGYTGNDQPSPVYMRTANGTTQRIFMELPDGTVYTGHGSGITSDDTHIFLTQEEGLLVFLRSEVAAAYDGQHVRAIGERSLDFSPAFLNIEDDQMYLGNFYHPGAYETPDHHHIATTDGATNPAVMYAYPADERGMFGYSDTAAQVYSIPERIQGMCELANGQIVLSQSYGLAASHLLFFDAADAPEGGAFMADGREVPLSILDSSTLVQSIAAPPMTEGIDYIDGRICIAEESATNKYIFGKIYGAGQMYALTPAFD